MLVIGPALGRLTLVLRTSTWRRSEAEPRTLGVACQGDGTTVLP